MRRAVASGAAQLIEFLQNAFGAIVEMRHDAGGHVKNAVVRLHDAALEIAEGDDSRFPAPAAFVLSVDDCEAVYRRALAAGARSLYPPAAQTFGGVMTGVADAWGNEWFIASATKA